MIAVNFRVVLTKNFRIVAKVIIKRVFKGNTVTDRASAPYRRSMSTQILKDYTNNNCYRFRDRLTKPVLYQVACQQLAIDRPPVNSSEYQKYFCSIVSQH